MGENGSGNGHKPLRDGAPVHRIRPGERPASLLLPTPEQGLIGCGVGLLALLLAALFWGWFFWRQMERERFPAHPPAGARGTKIRP